MFKSQLDALVTYAGTDRFKEQLLAAKAEYFASTGEIFEDDRSFEMRMASFLDYFVFDRVLPDSGKTLAQIFLEEKASVASEEQLQMLRGFTETRHSLYEVRKLAIDLVRLRDCFTNKDVDVFERRQPAGLKKGDLIDARLIPVDGKYLFSTAFCFHPTEAKKNVVRQIKQLTKERPDFSTREFLWTLANMRLKFERYRNIAVTDIYAFDKKVI